MKTIIRKDTKISYYLFANDAGVTLEETQTTTPNFTIGDMNSANAEIIENVEPPNDWYKMKYTYIDGVWALSSEWPAIVEMQMRELRERLAELEKGK